MKKLIILLVVVCLMLSGSVLANDYKVVAVVDFSNNTDYYLPQIGEMAAETLSIMVSKMEGFRVVERAKLIDVVTEQRFAKSGLVDNTDAAIQMGKLLGANYIVTGSIINLTEESSTFEGYGIKTTKVDVTVDVSIKMINTNTATIELADLYSASKSFQDGTPSNMTSVVRDLLKSTYRQFVDDANTLVAAPVEVAKNVSVEFNSTPAGADIEIDGVYMGGTPSTIPVQEGVHIVRISRANYQPWEKKVMFFDGLKVNVTLGEEKKGGDE